MLQSLIIEDDPSAADILRDLLKEHCPSVRVLEHVTTVQEAINAIKKLEPQLIFLDVELVGGNAFDVLQMSDRASFETIFVTAHKEYAVKAFKFCALDYILKPVKISYLIKAVENAEQKILSSNFSHQNIQTFLENLQLEELPWQKKIALPTGNGSVFVKLNDIIRCEADEKYSQCYLVNKEKYFVSMLLGDLEEMLHNHGFLRIHRSHLVNKNHIKKYGKDAGNYLVMNDNSTVEISKRKKDYVLKMLSHVFT